MYLCHCSYFIEADNEEQAIEKFIEAVKEKLTDIICKEEK